MPTILSSSPSSTAISRAVEELERGHCVAIPTETVYGLAADATNGKAVARIFEMKNRPHFNPLICHVGDLGMAQRHGEFDSVSLQLAARFWPGPLTLIVPLSGHSPVNELVTAGLDSVGLRCPAGISREIIAEFGKPLAAPSANRSGRISPTSASHVEQEFAGQDLLIVDGGPCTVGIESTIVRAEADQLVLLRPGSITMEEMEAETGLPVIAASGDSVEAPGMMKSHYAPRAMMRLDVTECPAGAALLAFGDSTGKNRAGAAESLNLSESGDLREAAANLYHHMKALDAGGPALIAVEPIPREGLGLAINDRLARAATMEDKHA